jgi:predicted  nucleic acid-binding Zn-ribbon protein
MGVTKQLYQLQEVDLEIESAEQSLRRMVSQLGESQEVARAKTRLASEQRRLEELTHRQHSAEWEVDDLVTKVKATEEQLYSGRIKNPKELSGLQHEVELLKGKRDRLENGVLEVMGQVEATGAGVTVAAGELNKLESEWQAQQKQLSADIKTVKSKLSQLGEKRETLSAEIDRQAVELYERLRKSKNRAVARVEQGICCACRISLPFSDLQQARSGNLVQCSSCSRILFLP